MTDNQTPCPDVPELKKWSFGWTLLGILFVDVVVAGSLYVWWTMP